MARSKTTAGRTVAESDWRPYYLEPTGPISWFDVFGNDRPVELEIGSGKGLFLASAAGADHSRNYFGVELARKFARFTAMRLAEQSLTNARIAQSDARRLLREWITPQSVAIVHVYFPDPWWKRRHKKRRIFNAESVAQMSRALRDGGELRVASDVELYFQEIDSLVQRHGGFHRITPEVSTQTEPDPTCLTNFERKYLKAGKPIWRAFYRLQSTA